MLPFTSSHLSMDQGLLEGVGIHSHGLVVFDPFSPELDNANKVVFATSGVGKSYACKVEALRALLLGIAYHVIDPEDEYRRLCEAVGGQFVRIAGSSPQHINPFDLPPADQEEGDALHRDPLAEKILGLHGLFALMLAEPRASLGQHETAALDAALYETYRRAGISPEPRTHHRLAPVLGDLHAVLVERGDPHGLATRLARYVDGSLGRVFASRTSINLDRPFVVFGVRDLEPELRPLGIYLIADYLWREVRRRRAPRMLLIDEAWQLVQHPEGARFLAAMARQARKHYLGLTTITQDVADFLATPEGHTVLANAATRLLLRQDASTIDAVTHTFQLSVGERQFLLSCGKGEGLFMARGSRVALRVVASPQEHALATTDPVELAALGRKGEGRS
jgi:type IV secretory pathway VirB4 component